MQLVLTVLLFTSNDSSTSRAARSSTRAGIVSSVVSFQRHLSITLGREEIQQAIKQNVFRYPECCWENSRRFSCIKQISS